ncbi:MAG: DUF167 domain-containing protein [Anaerolineales bacterium]
MPRKYILHDGKRGSALVVRVAAHAKRNQIVGILNDGTVKVQLASDPVEEATNRGLLMFLADVLGVPKSRLEIVAGENGRDKLISVLDMDVGKAHQRILAYMD